MLAAGAAFGLACCKYYDVAWISTAATNKTGHPVPERWK